MTDTCDLAYERWPLDSIAHKAVCELLEKWALDPSTIPTDAGDRCDALNKAGLGIRGTIKKVNIHWMVDPHPDTEGATLNLVLPLPCQLRKKHKEIEAGEKYALPDAFTEWVKGDENVPKSKNEEENLKFYQKYFCEYVLQHCG